jgi:hypothetical protein
MCARSGCSGTYSRAYSAFTSSTRALTALLSTMTPPYIGLFPGTKLTFRESLATERPSPQQWPHRPYAELLEADVLPTRLANLVIDCMRAYGATTLGVVANVGEVHEDGREILGFISYGYAQMLLRLDRVEEFLLFLYSHRYHAHTRGSWTAGEVTGITGASAPYCVPAQQTIPLLVCWMLVLEDSDEDRLHLAGGCRSNGRFRARKSGLRDRHVGAASASHCKRDLRPGQLLGWLSWRKARRPERCISTCACRRGMRCGRSP